MNRDQCLLELRRLCAQRQAALGVRILSRALDRAEEAAARNLTAAELRDEMRSEFQPVLGLMEGETANAH